MTQNSKKVFKKQCSLGLLFLFLLSFFSPVYMSDTALAQSIITLDDCGTFFTHPLMQNEDQKELNEFITGANSTSTPFPAIKDSYILPDSDASTSNPLDYQSRVNSVYGLMRCFSLLKQDNQSITENIIAPHFVFNDNEILFDNTYDSIKQIVIKYQRTHQMTADGVIGPQTIFMMGHQLGQIIKKLYNYTPNSVCNDTIKFEPANFISDKKEGSETTASIENRKQLTTVINCVYGTDFDEYEEKILNEIIADNITKLNNPYNGNLKFPNLIGLIDENRIAGINVLFDLAIHAGLRGLNYEVSPSATTLNPYDLTACNTINFSNEILFISQETQRDNDILSANQLIQCLHTLYDSDIRGFLELLNEAPIPEITSNSYGDVKPIISHYQTYNQDDYKLLETLSDNVGIGTLDIGTAFQLGVQIGKMTPQTPKTCQNEVIYFRPAHSISDKNQGRFNSPNLPDLIEYLENGPKLATVLRCTGEFDNAINDQKVGYQAFPVSALYNHYKDYTRSDSDLGDQVIRIGITGIYKLGKIFGAKGGNTLSAIEYEKMKAIDYCDLDNLDSLAKKIYLTNAVNLVPRNPGVLDWRDINESGIREECLTGGELTASLIGRLIRFAELFVGVIAVFIFIYGGFLYITAHGDENISQKGLKTIYIGVGGIFIILMARFITEILVPISEDGISIDRSRAFTTDIIANTQIAEITNWVLGFAAFIAISMLIYGGYLWLISGGDETLETKAKGVLRTAIIGFIIIFSAYTITMVVLGGAKITDEVNLNTGQVQNNNNL
jgi:hypothetical protein